MNFKSKSAKTRLYECGQCDIDCSHLRYRTPRHPKLFHSQIAQSKDPSQDREEYTSNSKRFPTLFQNMAWPGQLGIRR
ncbi:hypothetical protein P280DRAFT_474939 [Massarina eburnea CBS 473.64]|uniref:Uncharacterized protein n=1 Tax=Massarina eburnea CBS 473.64 TaxID=1395130 RepID=A0A6A6RF17_9PLEO|nr:hypothetical protein P280DRAFT_474939 [Massarina eburnea CBS 473.64]